MAELFDSISGHAKKYFRWMPTEVQAETKELVEELTKHAWDRQRNSISWEEFVVANEMWHDDGVLTDSMFRGTDQEHILLCVIIEKWHENLVSDLCKLLLTKLVVPVGFPQFKTKWELLRALIENFGGAQYSALCKRAIKEVLYGMLADTPVGISDGLDVRVGEEDDDT